MKLGLAGSIAVFSLAVFAQQVSYLDLTDPAPRQPVRNPNGGIGFGCAGSGDADQTSIPELTLTLVSVDQFSNSVGEDVTFEVRVENTGRESVDIPWTRHLADLEPSDPTQSYTYRSAVVALKLIDSDSQNFITLFSNSYGSTRVPGTTRALRPGQSLVIRARSKLALYDESWRKKVNEVRFLPVKAEPGFMLNTVTYSANGKGDSASQYSSCIQLDTKKANQIEVVLWSRSVP